MLLYLEVAGVNRDALLFILQEWIRRNWWEVVGHGDIDHFKHGTKVEDVRSGRGVVFYVDKYMSKPVILGDEGWGSPGRWWGIFNKAALPVAARLVAKLLYNESCDLIRWLRRFRNLHRAKKKRRRDLFSLWAFVADPDRWISNFDRYCDRKGVV